MLPNLGETSNHRILEYNPGTRISIQLGLPIRNHDNHAGEIASMSLHLLRVIKSFKIKHRPEEKINLRIGVHTGMFQETIHKKIIFPIFRLKQNDQSDFAFRSMCSWRCRVKNAQVLLVW